MVKKAEVDSGRRASVPAEVAGKVKALEREVRELRQANEILRKPFLSRSLTPDGRVDGYVTQASSKATLRAYQSDSRLFSAWCAERGYRPRPATPAIVAVFLTLFAETAFAPQRGRGGREPSAKLLVGSTIGRRLAATLFAHLDSQPVESLDRSSGNARETFSYGESSPVGLVAGNTA